MRNHFSDWMAYLLDYIRNTFFSLVILFIVAFFGFGLFLNNFLTNNFILFSILAVAALILIRGLLFKRARPTKIAVILVVFILAWIAAEPFAIPVFGKIGLLKILIG
jgi:membrane-bound ClpP family serine protease